MPLKTKPIPIIQTSSNAEDAAISAGIAKDADARELDDEWFANAQPAS
jgi:hypothetical protein